MGLLLFKKCFFASIVSGTKVTTLRRWKTQRLRAGARAFCPGLGWLDVTSVDVVELNDLTDADAHGDGFDDHAGMMKALEEIYPDHATDGRIWFKVRFAMNPDGAQA